MASLKSPSLVLDASAVVRIIEGSPQAAAFQQVVLEAELVLAPELMLTEVTTLLWRLERAGQLQPKGLQQCLSRAAALVDHIEPDRHLQVEALVLACHLDHPVDDCLDLACGSVFIHGPAQQGRDPMGFIHPGNPAEFQTPS